MTQTSRKQGLLLVELNEFNLTLLNEAAECHALANIKRILQFSHTKTRCDEREEHQGLDPWVQWVSVHTGQRMADHGVKRFGDGGACTWPSLWSILHSQHVATTCWGVMNTASDAAMERTPYCKLHVPDPWSFDAPCIPSEYKEFTGLARHYAQNYVEPSLGRCLKEGLKLGLFLAKSPKRWLSVSECAIACKALIHLGPKSHTFLLLYELLSCRQYIAFNRKHDSGLKIFFINALAHFQHHFWQAVENPSSPMAQCLRVVDCIIGMLISEYGNTHKIVVANALSQTPFESRQRILYRQRNHMAFVRDIGIHAATIRPLMTNDAHLFFADQNRYDHALDLLLGATLNGKAMFQVDTLSPQRNNTAMKSHKAKTLQFFYQLIIWDELPEDCKFFIGEKQYNFFEHFEKLHPRTGQHSDMGDILSQNIMLPKQIQNHELFHYILKEFKV